MTHSRRVTVVENNKKSLILIGSTKNETFIAESKHCEVAKGTSLARFFLWKSGWLTQIVILLSFKWNDAQWFWRRIPNIPDPTNGLRCVCRTCCSTKGGFRVIGTKKVLVSAVALQLALGWKAYDPYFTVIFLVLIWEQNVASPP